MVVASPFPGLCGCGPEGALGIKVRAICWESFLILVIDLAISGYGQEESTRRSSSKTYFYNAIFFLLGALACLSLLFWFPRSDGIPPTPGIPQCTFSQWYGDFAADFRVSVYRCYQLHSQIIMEGRSTIFCWEKWQRKCCCMGIYEF